MATEQYGRSPAMGVLEVWKEAQRQDEEDLLAMQSPDRKIRRAAYNRFYGAKHRLWQLMGLT